MMNPTPEKPTSSPNASQARRDLTPEERALLPDFEDNARVGAFASEPKNAAGEKSALWGGAVCGCFGNFVLGFGLLAFERAGLKIYGPGALALLAGLILLAALVRVWPRRVWLGMAAFGVSLVLSYGLLYLLLRPALNSFDPSKLPDVPPDETGHVIQVPAPSAPPDAGEVNS